jgi:hypothetical protein
MPLPFRLEHAIEKLTREWPGADAARLSSLSGRRLSRAEEHAEWPRVLEHKWLLSERLGRDVGLRVAAVDYFENLRS